MKATDLKKRREKLGMTQKQLAEHLGYTENYIWMLENGRAGLTKPERFDLMLTALETQSNPKKKK